MHAAADFIIAYPKESAKWHKESNYIITLSVVNEQALLGLADKLSEVGTKYVLFREPDIDNQVTSICIEPSEAVRKLCSNFPLALKEYNIWPPSSNWSEQKTLNLSVVGSSPTAATNNKPIA